MCAWIFVFADVYACMQFLRVNVDAKFLHFLTVSGQPKRSLLVKIKNVQTFSKNNRMIHTLVRDTNKYAHSCCQHRQRERHPHAEFQINSALYDRLWSAHYITMCCKVHHRQSLKLTTFWWPAWYPARILTSVFQPTFMHITSMHVQFVRVKRRQTRRVCMCVVFSTWILVGVRCEWERACAWESMSHSVSRTDNAQTAGMHLPSW